MFFVLKRTTFSAHPIFNLIPIFFFRLVAVDFHTQVVPRLLPVHLAVSDGEEIFITEDSSTWYLYERHAGRHVVLLRGPVGDVRVGWGPLEVSQALDLNTLLVQEAKRLW